MYTERMKKEKERSERTSWGWLIFFHYLPPLLSSRVPEIIEEIFWVPWLMVFLSSFELLLVQRGRIKTKTTRPTHFISIRECFLLWFSLYCARILTHKVIHGPKTICDVWVKVKKSPSENIPNSCFSGFLFCSNSRTTSIKKTGIDMLQSLHIRKCICVQHSVFILGCQ